MSVIAREFECKLLFQGIVPTSPKNRLYFTILPIYDLNYIHTSRDNCADKLLTKYVEDTGWLPNDLDALIQREEEAFGLVMICK